MATLANNRWAILVVLVTGLWMFGPAPAFADEPGEKLFKKRCAKCHDLPTPGKLTSEEWIVSLDSMAKYSGLKKNQKQDVLSFLQSHSKKAETIVSMAKEQKIFEKKCTACHSADRVFIMKLTPKSRQHIVKRMQERAPGLITANDAEKILEFLDQGAPDIRKPERKPVKGDTATIFRERCTACHSLERVFKGRDGREFTAKDWTHLVSRMREKAPDWISQKEARQITNYLKTLQPMTSHKP